jgi:glycosyltransferase involved in cell wall biosynthesis
MTVQSFEPAAVDRSSYRFGFVIEHAIGHVTFANMLQAAVEADAEIEAECFLLPPVYDGGPHLANLAGLIEHLPPFDRNPTMLHSLRAKRMVGRRRRHLDAVLIHTQTAALLSWPMLRRLPIVVSLDATPANFDEVGTAYGHAAGSPAVEAAKRALIGAVLRRTAAVMPWSHWVARSLIEDYRVPESKIRLRRPGIYPEHWSPKADYGRDDRARFLFVGGHFRRKGGDTLLEALEGLDGDWQLDVVTKSDLPDSPRLRVFKDIDQGDERFAHLYREADAFVLPTHGDAYGWAILEAMAAGLPTVSTSVGAIPEIVLEGETGSLVQPRDPIGLRMALERIMKSADLRRSLGENARRVLLAEHNAHANMQSVLEMMKAVSRERGAGSAR